MSNLLTYIQSQTKPKYTDLQQTSLSQYIKTQTAKPPQQAITQTAKEKYGDTLYVPASPYAVENEKRNKLNYIVNDNYKLTKNAGMNNPYSKFDYINDNERMVISDYVAKKKYDSAYNYLDYIDKDLNKRQSESESKQIKKFAEKHPLTAVVTKSLNMPFGLMEYGVNLADYADKKLQGKPDDLDVNSSTFSTSRYREAVNESLLKDQGIIGKIARSATMSSADQYALSKIVGAGPLTELFMAGQSAQDSLYENLKNGVTTDKAVVNSLGKGAISYATNRLNPSEKLMATGRQSILNSAHSEGSENALETVLSNLWDAVQLGEESDFSRLVEKYHSQGYSENDAVLKAVMEKYAFDPLASYATGAVTGGLIRGGLNYLDNVSAQYADMNRLGIVHKDFANELNRQLFEQETDKPSRVKQAYEKAHDAEMAKWTDNIDLANSVDYTINSNWVKENNIVTTREYEDFYSKVMSINTGTHFTKADNGLYIIPTGDEFGVNNTLIFTDGDSVNPSIEKVVHIFLDDETDIEKVRDYIYGKEINKWPRKSNVAEALYGSEHFNEYTRSNSRDVQKNSGRKERSARTENKPDNRQLHNRTGNTGESEITLTGYLGESAYQYYDDEFGAYFVTLVNGEKKRFYVPSKKSKDKRYKTIGNSYSSIKSLIKAENRKILKKSNKDD